MFQFRVSTFSVSSPRASSFPSTILKSTTIFFLITILTLLPLTIKLLSVTEGQGILLLYVDIGVNLLFAL